MSAPTNTNLADRSGGLVETQRGYDPRVVFFYFVVGGLLVLLFGGLAYQQIIRSDVHNESERRQNQRRIVFPGPRGQILDRNGTVLAGNQSRLSAVLYVGDLDDEISRAYRRIGSNYRDEGLEVPSGSQLTQIARFTVVQQYLDQLNLLLERDDQVDREELSRQFNYEPLLPFTLIDDLTSEEYARLTEGLPVTSPIQIYPSSKRVYPFGSAAAHTIGRVKVDPDPEIEDFDGDDLKTFRMSGLVGDTGLERRFDDQLQGGSGGRIIMVDPFGYGIDRSLTERSAVPGADLVTSLDIEMQQAAEAALEGYTGAAVALDVNTGEVLTLASSPTFDLNAVSPRMSNATFQQIQEQVAWVNRGMNGLYLPGSSFKLVVAIAGLRSGDLTPGSTYFTDGVRMVGNRPFRDAAGEVTGLIDFRTAISKSVNTYFIEYGLKIGADRISAEAARLGLTRPTGIELPGEEDSMYVGNDAWKRARIGEPWRDGDTANISIGQGYVQVTPLQMAALVASIARRETTTQPHLVHDPNRPRQQSEPLGLTDEQYRALIDAMEEVTLTGTASRILNIPALRINGLRIAGKTGTAQKDVYVDGVLHRREIAWFVCFAPVQDPQVAIAAVVEGDIGENFAGSLYAGPVAQSILRTWWNQRINRPAGP